jgi:TfoX/Sxy family transcriptional regulator of competence genes
MTEDDVIADLRETLPQAGKIREVRMFGGTGFMLNGNMVAGTFKKGLLLRVGADRLSAALKVKGARQMEMGGRLMEGYVYLDTKALTSKAVDDALKLAVAFVTTLPPKAPKASKTAKKKRG